MRIVYFLRSLDLGGTTKTAEIFARETHKAGHDVSLVYFENGDLTRLGRFMSALPEGHIHPYKGETDAIRIIKDLSPRVVHVFRAGTPEFPHPAQLPLGTKFVDTNVFGFIDPNPLITKTLFMSKWLMDHNLRPDLFAALPAERFDFINNPVDLPVSQQKLDLGLTGDTIILGRCGRSDDGIYEPINVLAAARVKAKGFKVFFLVVSPPPAMVRDLDKHSIPYRVIQPTVDDKELSKFYNTIDILTHSRVDGESGGNTIYEAMIHGKPVITHVAIAKHPGMGVFQNQTVVVEHGKTGFVCRGLDVNEYALYIEKLIRDKDFRLKMGIAGYTKALAECESSVSAAKLLKIYEELV